MIMVFPHAYKLDFSTALGHYYYLRMGQATSEDPETYTQLKKIVTVQLPSSNSEPVLSNYNPEHTIFNHFVDDNIREVGTLSGLVDFLHNHYSPQNNSKTQEWYQ